MVYAQVQDSLVISFGRIDTVVVTGNEKTQEYVILDEMILRPGMDATQQEIEFDRNRVYKLGLFNRVDMWCDMVDGKLALNVDVSERWYIIPLPVFGFAEGDVKKPFYGGGVLHKNFQGKNQRLFGLVTFGYNPSLTLSFQNPQISREHSLYFSTSLSYSKVRNKSEIESSLTGDFDEKHYNVNATLGKRLLATRLLRSMIIVKGERCPRTAGMPSFCPPLITRTTPETCAIIRQRDIFCTSQPRNTDSARPM